MRASENLRASGLLRLVGWCTRARIVPDAIEFRDQVDGLLRRRPRPFLGIPTSAAELLGSRRAAGASLSGCAPVQFYLLVQDLLNRSAPSTLRHSASDLQIVGGRTRVRCG